MPSPLRPARFGRVWLRIVLALSFALAGAALHAQQSQQQTYPADDNGTGTIRLRSPQSGSDREAQTGNAPRGRDRDRDRVRDGQPSDRRAGDEDTFDGDRRARQPMYQPGEFEKFVQTLVPSRDQTYPPVRIRRFGAELVTRVDDMSSVESSPLVPADYLVKPGDEIVVTIWGSVDADLRLVVDRSGRITIPRVGPVLVSGVRYADLPATISQRVGQVFRNFQISVSLGQLRGVRIYVTGFVAQPGAYSVSSLATVTQALMRAGGPSAAGSFRNIVLRRGGKVVSNFDLYDLLLKGERGADRVLQPDDVVHVGPVGVQVALIGSVNQPAIFELKPGETVGDLLRMAGGFTAVADRSRLAVERLDDRSSVRIAQLALPAAASTELSNGDIVRAFSAVDVTLPVQRQNKRVRVEGEVVHPGEYVLPPESSIEDAIRSAGGITPAAYIFGTEFSRESVRLTQQENYDRALRDLETEFARATTTQRTATTEEAAVQTARQQATTRLVDRLRRIRPTGRIVLQLQPTSQQLPNLALEDGDRLYIPPRPTTVGVFGSVFNAGSYLWGDGRRIDDFLRLAGGPTRGADTDSVFVIRANGSVVSSRQSGGWAFRGNGLDGAEAEAGDTIFVPEEINKTTFVQSAKDWTQILYQFGVGLAAVATFRN